MADITSAEEFLSFTDLPTTKYYVKKWDRYVYFRRLDGVERDAFELYCRGGKHGKVRLLSLTLVNEARQPLFRPDDIRLNKLDGAVLSELFARSMEWNGFSEKNIADIEGESVEKKES